MDNLEKVRSEFSSMKLYQLERLVRKDYNKYEQEVYLIAVEELKKKTSDEYVRNIFNEMNNIKYRKKLTFI